VRITGGEARGRRLKSPRAGVRPTHSRVRESLFDIWARRVEGARFADLCAGVGAVGIEALSRGAANGLFVEASEGAARTIRDNLASLGLSERATVVRGDVVRVLRRLASAGTRFDLVFLDPPYAEERLGERTLEALDGADLLEPGGTVAWQHPRRQQPPQRVGGLALADTRRFGETTLSFYTRFEEEA
jgi:16S rRNA (guanine(966)-N(2))-methyltransferase RsmD